MIHEYLPVLAALLLFTKTLLDLMKPTKKRNTAQVTARLGDELDARLQRACEVTRLDASLIVRSCVEAFCDEVEEKGGIWLPLKVVPKKNSSTSSVPQPAGGAPTEKQSSMGSTARRKYRAEENEFPPRDIAPRVSPLQQD